MPLPDAAQYAPHRAAMFHIGRSGSTVLGKMLDEHPEIAWDGEVYAPIINLWRLRPGGETIGPMPSDALRIVRARLEAMR